MAAKYKRVLAILLLLLFVAQMLYISQKEQPKEEEELVIEHPLLIWYTDPDIQDYMEASAKEASERYQVEIRVELVSEVDYIENINKASVAEKMEGPDLYVASSALLEKATLAGLTCPVTDAGLFTSYSEKAIQAVTYDGSPVARPFYIETCFMLYNCYYVDPDHVPNSIDEILTYAEEFEADEVTEKVENIFKWNVADVIDNYMFLGAYTNLGGACGDDKSQVSLDLDKIEECMAYYQSLNSFFAIDADTVTSEEVIQEFIDGKTVFTIVNVPMLAELDRAVVAGKEPFYRVKQLPSLTEELDTRGLSVTNSVVVNPYSSNVDAANACARYLTKERASKLYEESGKLAACQSPQKAKEESKGLFSYRSLYDQLLGDSESSEGAESAEEYNAVYEAYEQAAEVPKIMELSNVWLQLEVVLADIWRGADAGEELAKFSELLNAQLD